ncbi:phage tail protein [Fertoebacter nigrum]|uniref:Phage tail protein n=1 Tax=Fertoeibacter niger TaxID=2656921 RepID=A0A8X8H4R3_9RHOB|nr:tail fiber protein [Fertoeibacter niger]NUB45593.1 phage tail protein [Fertoeibacter niger]
MTFLTKTTSCTLPALILALAGLLTPDRAAADGEPYVGEIAATGILGYCPSGWVSAEGQLLRISDNNALFSLFSTTFGGDGVTTFGIPDLRGRLPVASGSGPGLTPRFLGETGGQENVTFTAQQLATHNHLVNATNSDGNFPGPAGKLLAAAPSGGSGQETIYSDQPANVVMSSEMIGATGGSQPVSVQDPSLVIRYCVSLFGVYPTQN